MSKTTISTAACRRALGVGVVLAALLASSPAAPGRAQAIELLGDFPAATASWSAVTGTNLSTEGTAVLLTAVSVGTITACSALLAGVEEGWSVGASVDLDPGAGVTSPSTTLSFIDDQTLLPLATTVSGGVAPPGTGYVQLCVVAHASAEGVVLRITAASLSATAPDPPDPTPTASATPTPTATPTETATAAASPTATPSATATATVAATPDVSTTPPSVQAVVPPAAGASTPVSGGASALRNGDFEQADGDGPLHWDGRRGAVSTAFVRGGSGRSAVIETERSTAWIEQLVPVEPATWYLASARLAPLQAVAAGWLRIAWYASRDGSGGQTATQDSPTVEGASGEWSAVTTGPLRAPDDALSARVRVLVRPVEAMARLAVDDVTFAATAAPVPAATAVATGTPSADAPSSTPRASEAPAAPASPTAPAPPAPAPPAPAPPGGSTERSTTPAAPAGATAAPLVRISEVAPDPEAAGNDAAAEWVELVNLGAQAAALTGLTLEDPAGRTSLSDSLPPGGVLIVAGAEATFANPAADRVLRVTRIGNGLRNAGDTLRLVDADGRILDEVAWGDATGDAGASAEPLPAPGAGESIERWFDAAGGLLGARIASAPTPGDATSPPAAPGLESDGGEALQLGVTPAVAASSAGLAASSPPAAAGTAREPVLAHGTRANLVLWSVLMLVAVGALAGAAGFRLSEHLRERDDLRG